MERKLICPLDGSESFQFDANATSDTDLATCMKCGNNYRIGDLKAELMDTVLKELKDDLGLE
jgi:hypothetical protein